MLQRSLQMIVQRHEILRTTFTAVDGQPQQVIAPALRLPLLRVDLERLPFGTQEEQVRRLIRAVVETPFDLEGLIGLFMNVLALRTKLAGNSPFEDLLAQVRGADAERQARPQEASRARSTVHRSQLRRTTRRDRGTAGDSVGGSARS